MEKMDGELFPALTGMSGDNPHEVAGARLRALVHYAVIVGADQAMEDLGMETQDTTDRVRFRQHIGEESWKMITEHVAERLLERVQEEIECVRENMKQVHTGLSVYGGDLLAFMSAMVNESEEDEGEADT